MRHSIEKYTESPNAHNDQTQIIHRMHCHENEMHNQLLTTINVPIDNDTKNDMNDFAFANPSHQYQWSVRSKCENPQNDFNQLCHIAMSYELEIQKLDHKLQTYMKKYAEIKCCAMVLLDIVDRLKCKLRLMNHRNGEKSGPTEIAATKLIPEPIRKMNGKCKESNADPLSTQQIELGQNDNESRKIAHSICQRCGSISNEFNFQNNKSKSNQERNMVDENCYRGNFNYQLNESESLDLENTVESKTERHRKIDDENDRRKCLQNHDGMTKKSNTTVTTVNGRKAIKKTTSHVTKPESNKTIDTPTKIRSTLKTNTNRTVQNGIGNTTTRKHCTTKNNNKSNEVCCCK